MKTSLEKICNDFITNRDIIKDTFKWDNTYLIAVCAAYLCGKNTAADKEKLLECNSTLKQQTSVFSTFRGNVQLPLVTMLSSYADPESKLTEINDIYDTLKLNFFGSEYTALVSAVISDMITASEVKKYTERGEIIYKRMKKAHPFLTGSEDSVFAVLMAFSDKSDDELIIDMEKCYNGLKKITGIGDALQTLSHILALSEGTSEDKCCRVDELYHKILAAGRKYSTYYEISVLGALAMLSDDYDGVLNDILDADNFLASQKGYTGLLGIDKKTRLMHAVMLVTCDYSGSENASTAAITGTLAMIAAQQAAMCAVIAATAANTAANSCD